MTGHVVIDRIRPATPSGAGPAKACQGEPVTVSADIYKDGHDRLAASVRWRRRGRRVEWQEVAMVEAGNDTWRGVITCDQVGLYEFVVQAWTAEFAVGDLVRFPAPPARASKAPTGPGRPDQGTGAAHRADLTVSAPMALRVDPPLATRGAWYEFFPRSEGGLAGSVARLGHIADMGFDVVYLPPIHPIGSTARKGPGNTLKARSGDPGSPWAIGSAAGGHTAIHPDLGTFDDLDRFVAEADRLGLQVALDFALQTSPDHPWVSEHPEWYWHRTDGTIAYAENPPKKYQDIFPINFWPELDSDRVALWQACRDILEFWVNKGVKIFRVDNPHTKPMAFWQWLIADLMAEHPDVVLLAEAFTRPKVMAKLAEVGFSQSYTYFTWRHSADELKDYVQELAYGPTADFMRPNFWPNTPDILAGVLRHGAISAFRLRLVLAATLSPSYGIYSGYELGENQPADEANEEYLNSEKYEIKARDWSAPASLAGFIACVNAIRRRHRVFDRISNVTFHHSPNPALLVYSKHESAPSDTVLRPDTMGPDTMGPDTVLIVVNLDPDRVQEAVLDLDRGVLGLDPEERYTVRDELGGGAFDWQGSHPYVSLDPAVQPAHILSIDRYPGAKR
ncbi:MAG: maltotransferase domain-containing protein [Acidimicrobiales bacterium]